VLSQLYSASHHNRIKTKILFSRAVWTRPFDGRCYTPTGLNLSLAMIQGKRWRLRSGIAR
jgi:hypothetical protein